MARAKQHYVCRNCGVSTVRWNGKCDDCGAWNTIVAEPTTPHPPAGRGSKNSPKGKNIPLTSLNANTIEEPQRRMTSISEFDRVLGGGFVSGSAILIGGDPGIGKSTLLLQIAAACVQSTDQSHPDQQVIYVSGEEALAQLRLRANRLQLGDAGVTLAAATNVADILKTLETQSNVGLVIIDSIQTMWSPAFDAAPGTVSQVRLAAQELVHYAKQANTTVILVGHVTKDGQIAGPRVLEHMVDTVIYFEGETSGQYRLLRAVKNRFGPAHEIGVFEMKAHGLVPIDNPSTLFLDHLTDDDASPMPGAAIFAGIEGTRPLFTEIQALTTPSSLAMPRRAVVGWDGARLSMILAVLEARAGLSFAGRDVFLNIAGGLRITEPAADLAVAAALISAHNGTALPKNSVLFGEISLSGAIRPVSHTATRLNEIARLGFTHAITPPQTQKNPLTLTITQVAQLNDLLQHFDISHLQSNELCD